MAPRGAGNGSGAAVTVEVVKPQLHGIDRVCLQPGTVDPYQWADLYAKVSGFLAEQSVDIGDHVKEGQLLARIALPESEKEVLRDKAEVEHAEAKVKQMEAKIAAAEADARAAKAMIAFAEAQSKSKTSYRTFRGKQLDRMKELALKDAIDPRLRDESEDQYEAAFSAEIASRESVNSSKQQAEAAESKVGQARADLAEAKAGVRVAEATLGKAQVLFDYTRIVSPYDGVITKRNYLVGAYIRAADQGGNLPLLSVERTDKMRVVIQVPDRDVAFVTVGDPAQVAIDALGGRTFEGQVSRYADAEDPNTRLMRTEVDILNPDGALRRGMYGQTTLILEKGSPKAFTVPTAALEGRAGDGHAAVRVVRDGRIQVIPVRTGTDNGIEAEVLDGILPTDQIVVRSNGAVEDGTPVTVIESSPGGYGH